MEYLYQNFIAFDQAINCFLNGCADETMSSRIYRTRHKPIPRIMEPIVNWIFFWQDDHCKKAYIKEVMKRHLPPNFELAYQMDVEFNNQKEKGV